MADRHPADVLDSREKEIEALKKRRTSMSNRDWKAVLNMPGGEGKRVLLEILNMSGYFAPCTATNASVYLYNGARNLGISLTHKILSVSPQTFSEMLILGTQEYKKGEDDDE